MTSSKRVVVTGAGGFVGRWAVPALIDKGYDVHAILPCKGSARVPVQLQEAHVHRIDLLDRDASAGLMKLVRPTHLLHFAWVTTAGSFWTSPENAQWVTASLDLLKSFQDHHGARALMAGTCAEYDWTRVGVCHEFTSPLAGTGAVVGADAITAYAESKLALQAALASFGRTHDLSTAWGRIFFLFGPDEKPERLVSSVICRLLARREAFCSHGKQVRSFMHVADVGAAFAALLDSAVEGPVNIGSADELSIAELVDRIAAHIGHPELVRMGARQSPLREPPVLIPDVSRLQNEVGWRPHFNLDAALADTIDWWRRQ